MTSTKSLIKKKYVRGKLNFDSVCCGCGERINKATDMLCYSCGGGHDVHTRPQAISLLGSKVRDRDVVIMRKGEEI